MFISNILIFEMFFTDKLFSNKILNNKINVQFTLWVFLITTFLSFIIFIFLMDYNNIKQKYKLILLFPIIGYIIILTGISFDIFNYYTNEGYYLISNAVNRLFLIYFIEITMIISFGVLSYELFGDLLNEE